MIRRKWFHFVNETKIKRNVSYVLPSIFHTLNSFKCIPNVWTINWNVKEIDELFIKLKEEINKEKSL